MHLGSYLASTACVLCLLGLSIYASAVRDESPMDGDLYAEKLRELEESHGVGMMAQNFVGKNMAGWGSCFELNNPLEIHSGKGFSTQGFKAHCGCKDEEQCIQVAQCVVDTMNNYPETVNYKFPIAKVLKHVYTSPGPANNLYGKFATLYFLDTADMVSILKKTNVCFEKFGYEKGVLQAPLAPGDLETAVPNWTVRYGAFKGEEVMVMNKDGKCKVKGAGFESCEEISKVRGRKYLIVKKKDDRKSGWAPKWVATDWLPEGLIAKRLLRHHCSTPPTLVQTTCEARKSMITRRKCKFCANGTSDPNNSCVGSANKCNAVMAP